MNKFVHLRNYSQYSLSKGALKLSDLAKYCYENKFPAVAITDFDNLFGALEFCLKMVSCGIQPIIGIQVNISKNSKDDTDIGEVVLLAKNELVYKNLLYLTTNFLSNEATLRQKRWRQIIL